MQSNLRDFKSELIDFVRVGPAQKYWEINVNVEPTISDMLQQISNIFKTKNKKIIYIDNKIKLNKPNLIKFDWLYFVDFLVNPNNENDFLDQSTFNKIGFDTNTKYALYKCFGNSIGNLEGYDPKEGRLKKETNLKNYLHKRLTISEKEAGLIEAIVKQYVQKKKVSETKNRISSDYEGYEDEDEYGIPETSHKFGYPDKDPVSSIGADEEEWNYFGDKKAFDKKHPELRKKKPKRK